MVCTTSVPRKGIVCGTSKSVVLSRLEAASLGIYPHSYRRCISITRGVIISTVYKRSFTLHPHLAEVYCVRGGGFLGRDRYYHGRTSGAPRVHLLYLSSLFIFQVYLYLYLRLHPYLCRVYMKCDYFYVYRQRIYTHLDKLKFAFGSAPVPKVCCVLTLAPVLTSVPIPIPYLCKVHLKCNYFYMYRQRIYTRLNELIYVFATAPIPKVYLQPYTCTPVLTLTPVPILYLCKVHTRCNRVYICHH